MRERLKTIILVSLVSISLLLTRRVWVQAPNDFFKVFSNSDKAYSSSYLLSDMIIPNKHLLNFSEKYHAIFYDDTRYGLWGKTRKVLGSLLGSKDVRITDLSEEDLLSYRNKGSITFYFPERTSTYILAKAMDVKDPKLIVDKIPNVESIQVYIDKEDSFFVFTDGQDHKAIRDGNLDLSYLREQFQKIESEKNYSYYYSSRDTYGTEGEIFIPYEVKSDIPSVYVENEIRNIDDGKKREMAQRFFSAGIDEIREIVEDNESTIYEHKHRILKLNVNGTIEYFHPLEESFKKRNLYNSLTTAADFISNRAGVTQGMYLTKVEDIEFDGNLGYKLTFRYRIKGLPVILGNEEVEDFIQIEVFDNHIQSYSYFVRKEMKKNLAGIPSSKKILTSLDVIDIDENYNYLVDRFIKEGLLDPDAREDLDISQLLSNIVDINLSYFDPCLKDIEDQLMPVWAIKTENSLYAFNIYDGSLVYEKIRR